jgi:hypothetical protein
MAFTKHLKRRQRKMTQKVRKWLKRRGLRGGSGSDTATGTQGVNLAVNPAVKPEVNLTPVVKPEVNLTPEVKPEVNLTPEVKPEGVDENLNLTPEENLGDISASSDKQAIFKKALTEARNAVETALTAYP